MTGTTMSTFLQKMLKSDDEIDRETLKSPITPTTSISKSTWKKMLNSLSPKLKKKSKLSNSKKNSTKCYNPPPMPLNLPSKPATDLPPIIPSFSPKDTNPPLRPTNPQLQSIDLPQKSYSFCFSTELQFQNTTNNILNTSFKSLKNREKCNMEKLIENFEHDFVSPKRNPSNNKNYVKQIVAAYEEKFGLQQETKEIQIPKSVWYKTNVKSSVALSLPSNLELDDDAETVSLNSTFHTIDLEIDDEEVDKYQDNNDLEEDSIAIDCSVNRFWSDKVLSLRELKAKDELRNKENPKLSRSVSWLNKKAPKIVGAFLKKPVEVENTSVNWIPLPGKKLPRKHSLKKLLSKLTCRRKIIEKKKESITEDYRVDHRDSGYEENSISASSVASLTSMPKPPKQHTWSKNTAIQIEKRSVAEFRTFPRSSLSSIIKYAVPRTTPHVKPEEDNSDTESVSSGKMMLHEVPRDKLSVDLGPSFPPTLYMTKSLDRNKASVLRYACLDEAAVSTIENIDSCKRSKSDCDIDKWSNLLLERHKRDSMKAVTDLYELDFLCKNCTHKSIQLSSSGVPYDVPKKYLSTSEPTVSELLRLRCSRCNQQESIYDEPSPVKPLMKRPLSDCGLARTNSSHYSVPRYSYYSSKEREKFATIKPRRQQNNFRIEFLRSISDLGPCTAF